MSLVFALRSLAATVAAVWKGVVTAMRSGDDSARVELKPGDVAPAFALPGSDGRVYRLSDFAGRATVVLAWFPKAFTGG